MGRSGGTSVRVAVQDDLIACISGLIAKAGRNGSIFSVTPCSTGGNNRTYRVSTSEGDLAAKQYFRHEGDERDRLNSEYMFLTYANEVVSGSAPAPLAMDRESGLALYEFVEGNAIAPDEITWDDVRQAAEFLVALNVPEARLNAQYLPNGSEARFSVFEHLDLIESRLAALAKTGIACDEDRSARTLVDEITIRWRDLKAEVMAGSKAGGLDPAASLGAEQRCISPSDFGFHNALRQTNGRIRFLDFEYAGWDDPGKLSGDFFSQLAVPVPGQYFDAFVNLIMKPFAGPEELVLRAGLLRRPYRIKWCCIALNVFLPVNLARRKFANPHLDEALLKRQQLVKANNLFNALEF